MIFPEEYPKITHDLSNERVFHARFKKELGREFTVYYSVRLTTPDVPMREIDFLVISPRMILCIELKNGKWRYRDSKWEFYNRRGKSWEEHKNKPYRGPVEQIRSAKKILKDFLYHHNSFEHPVSDDYFQSSIFFLKNDPGDFPISDREKEYFVGKSKLKNSHLTMQNILTELQNSQLDPLPNTTIKNLHNIIRLNLNFATDIGSKKRDQHTQLIALTREQFEVVDRQRNVPRTIVLGVPGSGKTVVGTEYAFRLEASHTTTLYITSNPSSAKILANMVRWFSVDFATPATLSERSDSYDFVIMDSCEHYLTPEFLEKFESLPKQGWESGEWLVLGDWDSSLKDRVFREGLAKLRQSVSQEVIWRNNIRTPKKVYELACLLGRREGNPSRLLDITGVHYSHFSNQEEFYQKLEWAILYGVRDLNIQRSEIVILSLDKALTQEVLYTTQHAHKRGHSIVPFSDIHEPSQPEVMDIEERVTIADLDAFYGKETSYVILIGIEDFNDPLKFDDYFHALTRCNTACTILFPEKLEDQLTTILQSKSRILTP